MTGTEPDRHPHRLPTDVVPTHYDLDFAPDLEAATFTGRATAHVDVLGPVQTITMHSLDIDLGEAWVEQDGNRLEAEIEVDTAAEWITLTFARPLAAGPATVHTAFTGVLNDKLVGFYRSTFTDPAGATRTIACTQFESTHARRAFPCWDEPAFKATYAISLTVAPDLLAVSNSGEAGRTELADGRVEVRFATTMKMSTYLVAFVVGPLEATDPVDVDGVPLRVIVPPGKMDLTDFALDAGAFSLRFLADWYGIPYPGDKVDLIAIPDFAFGAMENLGCITFRETALLLDPERSTQSEQQRVADVIAHELAHMWFGDLVTMGWWNGIWLNEAFATFMEMLTVDAYRPAWQRWLDFGTSRSMAFDTDSLSSTRPIEYEVVTADDAEAMFDILTYEKGASVVRMLQQYLGEDRFQAGIRLYLETHAYQNTETTDLWDAIEQATGEPVRQIMDSWIFQPGHPVVKVDASAGGHGLTVSQSLFSFATDEESGREVDANPAPQSVPVVLRVGTDTGTEVHKVLLEGEPVSVAVTSEPLWIVGNQEGNGFYRTELSDQSVAGLAAVALEHLSPAERYGLVEDEWALVLGGRGSVERTLTVIRSLATDVDLSVWQRIIGVLGAIDRMVDGELSGSLATWVRGVVGPALLSTGTAPQPGEPERTTARRAALFEAAARLGRDRSQIDLATERFAAMTPGSPGVDPDMADAVIRVVAAGADEATWSELRRRATDAHTPQDRLRYQGAMADSSSPELVLRLAALVLTDEIRTQDGLFILRRALGNRHAHEPVWDFVESNWSEITTRFPSSTVPRLIDGIRPINDPSLARRVTSFLDAHPLPQGELALRQHVERMWVTVAAARRVPGELAAHLS
ncbi:MAG: M1 family metallopeptidase [Acidimicrobiales bacterium]|nr:M1 family metallopeptidase [Acidimicrobiales bacterium]